MTDEIIEKNITVTLCISDSTGSLHLEQVGGQTLAKLIENLASVGDFPIAKQLAQRDMVGQDIFVTSDSLYFQRLGCSGMIMMMMMMMIIIIMINSEKEQL